MSFADLTRERLTGIDDAHKGGMTVYWFGLLGWLAILSLQLLFARAARARRRVNRES